LYDSLFEVLAVNRLHFSLQFFNQRVDLVAVLFLELHALIVVFELIEEVRDFELGLSLLEFVIGEGRFVLTVVS
jgi:hypothetical protein